MAKFGVCRAATFTSGIQFLAGDEIFALNVLWLTFFIATNKERHPGSIHITASKIGFYHFNPKRKRCLIRWDLFDCLFGNVEKKPTLDNDPTYETIVAVDGVAHHVTYQYGHNVGRRSRWPWIVSSEPITVITCSTLFADMNNTIYPPGHLSEGDVIDKTRSAYEHLGNVKKALVELLGPLSDNANEQ